MSNVVPFAIPESRFERLDRPGDGIRFLMARETLLEIASDKTKTAQELRFIAADALCDIEKGE